MLAEKKSRKSNPAWRPDRIGARDSARARCELPLPNSPQTTKRKRARGRVGRSDAVPAQAAIAPKLEVSRPISCYISRKSRSPRAPSPAPRRPTRAPGPDFFTAASASLRSSALRAGSRDFGDCASAFGFRAFRQPEVHLPLERIHFRDLHFNPIAEFEYLA